MLKSVKFSKKLNQFQKIPKVLLSGSFITYMRSAKKTHYHLHKSLGMKVVLFATSCSLKKADFGHEVSDEVIKRLKITIIGCSHKGSCEEVDCLIGFVRGGNKEGYFVATGDEPYVNQLQQLESVPVISYSGTQIFLKKPSEFQEECLADRSGREHRIRHMGRHGGVGRDHRGGGRVA